MFNVRRMNESIVFLERTAMVPRNQFYRVNSGDFLSIRNTLFFLTPHWLDRISKEQQSDTPVSVRVMEGRLVLIAACDKAD